MADAGGEGIVDRRMAERALDADRREVPTGVEATGHPDHRVELEQCQRGRRVVQVDLTPLELLAEASRQRVEVDLQADAECGGWTEARPDTAVLRAGDRLVEVQLAAPEILVAEGVEAEDLPSLLDQLAGIVDDGMVEVFAAAIVARGADRTQREQPDRQHEGWNPEPAGETDRRHAAAPTRPAGDELRLTRAASACASVRRTTANAAIAISTSRTATSKKRPVRTRLQAIARSQTIATQAPSRGHRVRIAAPTAISTTPTIRMNVPGETGSADAMTGARYPGQSASRPTNLSSPARKAASPSPIRRAMRAASRRGENFSCVIT